MSYETAPWYRAEFGKLRKHKSGHLIVKKGRFRDVGVHRAIVTLLMEEKPSEIYGDSIPEGFVVHHMDFNPAHNCPCNFILMEHRFHTIVSNYHRFAHLTKWRNMFQKSVRLYPQKQPT